MSETSLPENPTPERQAAVADVEVSSETESRPWGWRALLCLLAIVAAADIAIYRGEGFAGYAMLLAVVPLLLALGVAPLHGDKSLWIFWPLLILLCIRLVWRGHWLTVAVGAGLSIAVVMALVGLRPYVLEAVAFAAQTIPAGLQSLRRGTVRRHDEAAGQMSGRVVWSAILIPIPVLLTFSAIFLLANPELLDWFNLELTRLVRQAREFVITLAPAPAEAILWAVTAWIAAGLLRPIIPRPVETTVSVSPSPPEQIPLYAAFRNTLAGVVVLFAFYLFFEFLTLWTREFPEGFYYSGYAHEGAAWLTVALALATLVLSVIFQGRTMRDPRLPVLRRLAGVWAVENLLLAVAVYHRLFIYIGFNGMTRLRIVGLLGISAVVVGFILVLIKIRHAHNFRWLLRRDLWALAAAFYLYAVLPVDVIVMKYNVRRIMNGDSAPSVQITVQPISDAGLLVLKPLLRCENEIVQEGVRAILAKRLERFEATSSGDWEHWSGYQFAERRLNAQLRNLRDELDVFPDRQSHTAAIRAFADYAYQWY